MGTPEAVQGPHTQQGTWKQGPEVAQRRQIVEQEGPQGQQ